LIAAATLAVALAGIGMAGDIPYMQLTASVLVGISLILEPDVAAQPAGDIGPQSIAPPRI
jgi:hypothetical protein